MLLKFKKFHKLKLNYNKIDNKNFYPNFCEYGIQLKKSTKLTVNQLESVRRLLRRFFKKNVFIKMNLIFNSSLSKKAVSVRMGKGKGKHSKWVSPLNIGNVFIEFLLVNKYKFLVDDYFNVSKKLNLKLPVKSKLKKCIY